MQIVAEHLIGHRKVLCANPIRGTLGVVDTHFVDVAGEQPAATTDPAHVE
jgi:hypothetical protein